MALREQFETSGLWLFRYRSYLPLVLLALILHWLGSFTYLGQSHDTNEMWQLFCCLIALVGFAIRVITVGHVPHGTSGRNSQHQVADVLNTTGMYSVVRHPLYLGNYLVFLGFVAFFHSYMIALLSTCLFALYYERIMFAEEHFLRRKFGDAFEQWADTTPAFIPRMSGWKTAKLPFSIRTVLSREYSTLFLITSVFAVLDEIADSIVEQRLIVDWRWIAVFFSGMTIYITLRTMKKHSSWLRVADR